MLRARMSKLRSVANSLRNDELGEVITMTEYAVSYEGWYVVEANDEDHALELANKMLSDSAIANDGESGEWTLAGVEAEL